MSVSGIINYKSQQLVLVMVLHLHTIIQSQRGKQIFNQVHEIFFYLFASAR